MKSLIIIKLFISIGSSLDESLESLDESLEKSKSIIRTKKKKIHVIHSDFSDEDGVNENKDSSSRESDNESIQSIESKESDVNKSRSNSLERNTKDFLSEGAEKNVELLQEKQTFKKSIEKRSLDKNADRKPSESADEHSSEKLSYEKLQDDEHKSNKDVSSVTYIQKEQREKIRYTEHFTNDILSSTRIDEENCSQDRTEDKQSNNFFKPIIKLVSFDKLISPKVEIEPSPHKNVEPIVISRSPSPVIDIIDITTDEEEVNCAF